MKPRMTRHRHQLRISGLAEDEGRTEACRISGRLDGDDVFEAMQTAGSKKPAETFDPIELAGAWPGDEPLEDLPAQLD